MLWLVSIPSSTFAAHSPSFTHCMCHSVLCLSACSFDLGVLQTWFDVLRLGPVQDMHWSSIDTCDLAKDYKKETPSLTNAKLGTLVDYFGFPGFDEGHLQAHRCVLAGCCSTGCGGPVQLQLGFCRCQTGAAAWSSYTQWPCCGVHVC